MTNTNIINTTEIRTVDYLSSYKGGKFRMIAKCKAGYPSCNEVRFVNDNLNYFKNPGKLLNAYKKGSLLTIEFCPDGGDYWLTIFAKVGRKIKFMDEKIMADIEIGTINQLFDNTNLYNQKQYKAVNSKSWASKAFVLNEETEVSI